MPASFRNTITTANEPVNLFYGLHLDKLKMCIIVYSMVVIQKYKENLKETEKMMKKFTVIKTYIHEINEIGYGRELLGSFGKNGAEAINFARKNVDEGGGGIVYIAFESSENDIEIFTCKKDFPKDAVVVEIPVDETWTPEWAWKAMPERFTPAPCVK